MLCVLVEANRHSSWSPLRRILESGGVPACSFIAPVDVLALLLPTQLNSYLSQAHMLLYCYPKHMHFCAAIANSGAHVLLSQAHILFCCFSKLRCSSASDLRQQQQSRPSASKSRSSAAALKDPLLQSVNKSRIVIGVEDCVHVG